MPVATLKYSLPEEQAEFELAQNAGKYQSVLWELDQQVLRPITKHGVPAEMVKEMKETLSTEYPTVVIPSDDSIAAILSACYEEIRKALSESLTSEGVDIF